MANTGTKTMNKKYVIGVSVLSFLLPVACSFIEVLIYKSISLSFALFGKWFIFFAVGIRLLIAGIKQTTNPAFTAKQIFNLDSPESFPILRELGFANLCFGLIGIASLMLPGWRIVSAFGSGLYYGLAGVQHLVNKPAGPNEKFAMISDFLIFIFLAVYLIKAL